MSDDSDACINHPISWVRKSLPMSRMQIGDVVVIVVVEIEVVVIEVAVIDVVVCVVSVTLVDVDVALGYPLVN